MTIGTEIAKVVEVAETPITRLVEAVCGAVGKLYEPCHHRRMTDANVYRASEYSKVIKERSDVPIVFKDDQLTIDASDYEADYKALCSRASQRLAYQELTKQENIETIVGKAFTELESFEGKESQSNESQAKESQSDEKISPEWMNRFINTAGEIGTEEMQQLWAKVLAGEAVKPNSYSLRTLECLRNLSSSDAKLFEKISEFIIENSFLYNDNDLNSKYGIAYRDIIDLSDCGLISADGFRLRNLTVFNEPRKFIDFGEYVLVATPTTSEKEQIISFGDYLLSRAGRELVQIARKKSIKFDYVKAVSLAIKRNNKSNSEINITLHKVVQRDANGRVSHDTQDLMEGV